MDRIVECIPNFSDGRHPGVVEQIAEAIASVPNIAVLDRHLDASHNRSVITFAGAPEQIGEAAFRAAACATGLINLTKQQGGHPRIGATDVVPFVPIQGIGLDDCVHIAEEFGRRVAAELAIPVYLYEAAARRPDRIRLENIRRGQFEGLLLEIANNPERTPDFGAARLHPTAGAMVVGARKHLIAFNVNLESGDLRIAKAIAKQVRASSGGLPSLKAIGVFLAERNCAQVSMNLTDYEQTSMAAAFNAVSRAAEALGASVIGSEIVGLVPERAWSGTTPADLRVENYRPSMVLETRLRAAFSS